MTNAYVTSSRMIFCLKVSDISKLDKVYSPEVMIHNIPWKVCVQKLECEGKYSLFPFLHCTKNAKLPNWSHAAQATFKLLPFNESENETFIELDTPDVALEVNSGDATKLSAEDKLLAKFTCLTIDPIFPWDELFEPQNGFVKNDAIVMKVEIKASNPEGIVLDKQKEIKLLQLECAICLESFCNQNISTTQCGHLFCSKCISTSIKANAICPLCNTNITLDTLQRIYLPM